MRAVLLAVLVALCFAGVVSASSADWAAPADAWAPELSANELEGRHSEFMMALAASTGGASAGVPALVLNVRLNCTVAPGPRHCAFNATAFRAGILSSYNFPLKSGEGLDIFIQEYTYDDAAVSSSTAAAVASSTAAAVASSTAAAVESSSAAAVESSSAAAVESSSAAAVESSSAAAVESSSAAAAESSSAAAAESSSAAAEESSSSAGDVPLRRLLAVQTGTNVQMIFKGAAIDSGAASQLTYTIVSKSLKCQTALNVDACLNDVAAEYQVPSLAGNAFFTDLASEMIGVDEDADFAGSVPPTQNNVSADGHSRRTNGGYYFLAAVLILFIVIALVYFIVHKAPTSTLAESKPRHDEVDMVPVVAAGAPQTAEQQPIVAGDQQMDYRSVFALKNNVLDKNAEEKAADEHNHNDVHFILHQ